ncbi:hypothetical protein J6590_034014 [Homalodisca vitripennis]|nr:hypothetical protein J6590_034014 [Homalodisca vitripennis]
MITNSSILTVLLPAEFLTNHTSTFPRPAPTDESTTHTPPVPFIRLNAKYINNRQNISRFRLHGRSKKPARQRGSDRPVIRLMGSVKMADPNLSTLLSLLEYSERQECHFLPETSDNGAVNLGKLLRFCREKCGVPP